MGNHAAGQAIGLAAEHALSQREPGESALSILDRVCAKYRGYDAEFEAEDPSEPGCQHPEYMHYTDPHPNATLGMLLLEAFAPDGVADLPKYAAMLEGSDETEEGDARKEKATEAWWTEVYEPFRARFGFC